MKTRLLIGTGVLLVLMGGLGFLAAAVALARATELPSSIPAAGSGELRLDDNDPLVKERQAQAEGVLWGSLTLGAAGVGALAGGLWSRRQERAGG